MGNNEKEYGFSTRAVHSGQELANESHSLTTPIFQTSTYTFANTAELCDFFDGNTSRVAEYGRYGNPTQSVAQDKLKDLEGAGAALLFSSGMAAVTSTILAVCKQGDHIVITSDSYRRTRQFLLHVMPKFGVTCTLVEPDVKSVEQAMQENTRLLISEAPTNPYLRVVDLEAIVAIARKHRVKTLIDSTLATPYNLKPLDLGVDLVVHSVTKYLAGHNDVLAGVLLGKEHIIEGIQELQSMMGPVLDPNSSYLILRGLKTFALRMERQNSSGQLVAEYLESHPKVDKVWYPGLKSHPDHDVAKRLMKGFGSMVSFQIKGGLNEGSKLVDSMEIPRIAPSLGGVESLIEQPSLMSYYEMSSSEREAVGIFDNLIRFSIGIEDPDDLLKDLEQGLSKI